MPEEYKPFAFAPYDPLTGKSGFNCSVEILAHGVRCCLTAGGTKIVSPVSQQAMQLAAWVAQVMDAAEFESAEDYRKARDEVMVSIGQGFGRLHLKQRETFDEILAGEGETGRLG